VLWLGTTSLWVQSRRTKRERDDPFRPQDVALVSRPSIGTVLDQRL
jgi:hypothetical protein